MVADYDKPFLSISEQLALLEGRGMLVEDRAEAEHYLRHEGYYRLSSYWHPFRVIGKSGQREDPFVPGANFSDVLQLYEFDKWLRSLILSWLRGIEISVRVAVAHQLGEKDIFAHENPAMLNGKFVKRSSDRPGKTWHEVWLDKYRHLLLRNGREDFVQIFIDKYGTRIPIWVAIEIWDFGLLSRFFEGMKFNDQQAVSQQYGVNDPHLFASWLNSFNYVRNVCAHHSRLWNRTLIRQPRIPSKNEIPLLNHLGDQRNVSARTYTTLALCAYVLRKMEFRGPWLESLHTLLEKFPTGPCLSLKMMALPENWRQLPLWQIK